jgi:putative aldouronate transport system substrate-binding protein
MRTKKIKALFLSLILLSSLLTACAAKNDSSSQVGSTSPSDGGSTKKQMEITVAQWGSDAWEQNADDTWLKELGKKFNVTFKPIAITWADWQDKLKVWAASGNLPDLFVHDSNYFEWAKQGLLKPIGIDTLNKYPNIKKNIFPSVQDALTIDGKLYSIPRSNWPDSSQAVDLQGIYARKEYLQKAGLSTPPDTVDGWHDFLKKAVEQDYSGTGKTIGMGGIVDQIIVDPFVPNYRHWIQEDGKWIPGYFSKKQVDALKFGRQLYKEGLLDKDFAVRKDGDISKLFQQQRVAIFQTNADPDMLDNQITPEMMGKVIPSDFISLALPPKASDGNRYFTATNNYSTYTGISAKVSDEKLERILQILDYIGSPEGRTFSIYGREGVDFKKDGESIVSLLPKEPSGKQKTLQDAFPSSGFGRWFLSWDLDAAFKNIAHSQQVKQMSTHFFDSVRKETTIPNLNFKIELMSTPAKDKLPDLGKAYDDMLTKIIMSEGDVNQMFQQWVDEQMKTVGTAINEVNVQAANLK